MAREVNSIHKILAKYITPRALKVKKTKTKQNKKNPPKHT